MIRRSCLGADVDFILVRFKLPAAWDRQACSPLIQLFFGFASDIDQTNINRDIRDGNWLSKAVARPASLGSRSSLFPCFHFLSMSLRESESRVHFLVIFVYFCQL